MQGEKVIQASRFGPLEGQNYGTPLSPYGPGNHGPWEHATAHHSMF